MNTPTHLLVSAALLARPGAPKRNAALIAGALIPDLAMFAMTAWALGAGLSGPEIWGDVYYRPFWQTVFAVTNAAPLFAAAALAGMLAKRDWLWIFAASALAHVALDLPVHHDDGHPHFWPFTLWIFESPVSYWDPRHYGAWLGAFEIALAVALVVLLWRRFERPLPRAAIAVVAVSDLSVPFMFAF